MYRAEASLRRGLGRRWKHRTAEHIGGYFSIARPEIRTQRTETFELAEAAFPPWTGLCKQMHLGKRFVSLADHNPLPALHKSRKVGKTGLYVMNIR